jgi:hypothetical protein
MKTIMTAAAICMIAFGTAEARPRHGNTAYDGTWHLSFATQTGPCDPTYAFYVNISNGMISHPNLVKFHGTVAPNGSARASVTVQDKVAAGSGRLSMTSGQGSWKGRSGPAACAGSWTARKDG